MKKLIALTLILTLAGCATNPTTYKHTWIKDGITHEVTAKSIPFVAGKATLEGATTDITFADGEKTVTFGQSMKAEAKAEVIMALLKVLLMSP